MASTPILPLAIWLSGTNQNSIPANDNSSRIQLLTGNIISQAVTAQPGSPADGDAYIIASTHTGAAWSTFTPKDLAIYRVIEGVGGWYAFAPVIGVVVNIAGSLYQYISGSWTAVSGGGGGGTPTVAIPIACGDEVTAATTGTAKVTFRMPFAFTLSEVRSSLTTAPTGSTLIVDINESGTSILSTKLSIDASEKTSTTAATPAVISDTSLADDAEITIDIDQVGSTVAGAGLKVYLIGAKT